jgi:serine/threonine protein kinase
MNLNHYHTLEVHPDACSEVIEAAYKALMKRHHPDRDHRTRGDRARRLNAARDVLTNPTQRARYDAARRTLGGTVIGEFRLESEIAEGGFGKTYKGSHVTVGSPVCVKHCSQISPADTDILIEEARAMWDLRHFGIPAVRNLLKLDDGSLALVMSYVPGPTLDEVVETYAARRKRLDPEHVAWMIDRILNVLSYMHRHGIVHGDLKPQNIIIQPESHMVVLVDFGLAAIKPSRTDGSKGYTDLFSPPEQIRGGSPLLPQTDFYALGMTMIHALTGGDLARTERHQVPTSVPDPLCKFLLRLLVRNPLNRPSWRSENLVESFRQVRRDSFGDAHSNMKPLTL